MIQEFSIGEERIPRHIEIPNGESLKIDVTKNGADVEIWFFIGVSARGRVFEEVAPTGDLTISDAALDEVIPAGIVRDFEIWETFNTDPVRVAHGTIRRLHSLSIESLESSAPDADPPELSLSAQTDTTATFAVAWGDLTGGPHTTRTRTVSDGTSTQTMTGDGSVTFNKQDEAGTVTASDHLFGPSGENTRTATATLPALATAPQLASPQTVELNGEDTPATYDLGQHRTGGIAPFTWTELSNDSAGRVTHSGGVLTITQNGYSATGQWRVTDAAGRVADITIQIAVLPPSPTWLQEAQISGDLVVGGVGYLSAVADGSGPFTYTYQWVRDGGDIPETNEDRTFNDLDEGATLSGRVTATDAHGRTILSTAPGVVISAAVEGAITWDPNPSLDALTEGDTLADAVNDGVPNHPSGGATIVATIIQPDHETAVSGQAYTVRQIAEATDGTLGSATSDPVTAVASNQPPVAPDDGTLTIMAEQSQVIDFAALGSDPDADDLDLAEAPTATRGSFDQVDLEAGTARYTAPALGDGTDTINYVLTDGNLTDAGTIAVTVEGGLPTLTADDWSVQESPTQPGYTEWTLAADAPAAPEGYVWRRRSDEVSPMHVPGSGADIAPGQTSTSGSQTAAGTRYADIALVEVASGTVAYHAADKTYNIVGPSVDAFDLGGPYTGNPGAEVQLQTVTIAGIPAGYILPAVGQALVMRVLDNGGVEVSAKGAATEVNIQLGYQIEIWATFPAGYGDSITPLLDIGDEDYGPVVSDSATVTTHSLTVVQDGSFVTIESSGGDLEYDIDGDGTFEGVVTEAEKAALAGQAPYFDTQPSITDNAGVLTLNLGFPVWAGDNARFLLEVRDQSNVLLQSWDTDAGWAPDLENPPTYDASAASNTLTINWIISDSNGSTTVSDTYETGASELAVTDGSGVLTATAKGSTLGMLGGVSDGSGVITVTTR